VSKLCIYVQAPILAPIDMSIEGIRRNKVPLREAFRGSFYTTRLKVS